MIIAVALWWWLPRWQVGRFRLKIRDPKARAEIEDNFRKTVGQFLGGAAVLVGTGLAYYDAQQTFRIGQEQIVSQQISKGFELLGQQGDDRIVTRLGGIYALEGIMRKSDQYRQSILEALCAFIRDSSKGNKSAARLTSDVQAALTVIGRRPNDDVQIDLSEASIPGARLRRADLSDANLDGIDMVHANLVFANLRGSYLRGSDLTGADLTNTDLTGAKLSGAKLTNAHLGNANLTNADMNGANLRGAHLTEAILANAHFEGADLTETAISKRQLDVACGSNATKLPPNFALRPC